MRELLEGEGVEFIGDAVSLEKFLWIWIAIMTGYEIP